MAAKLDASALIYLGKADVSSQFSGALLAVAGLLTEPRRARSETGPSCPQIIEKIQADLMALAARVCGGLFITTGVYNEAVVRGRAAGHRDAERIGKAVEGELVQIVPLGEASCQYLEQAGFPAALGDGERETIVEALAQNCLAVLDDVRARSAAVILGAALCRTETLLVEALVRHLATLTEFETALLRLAQVRGMKPDDLAELLRLGRLIEETRNYDSTDA